MNDIHAPDGRHVATLREEPFHAPTAADLLRADAAYWQTRCIEAELELARVKRTRVEVEEVEALR